MHVHRTERAVHMAASGPATAASPSTRESAVALAPSAADPVRATSAPSVSGTDPYLLGGLAADPMAILTRLQAELRRTNCAVQEKSIESAQADAEAMQTRREQAIEQARQAANAASGFFDFADELAPWIKGLSVAAAVAAAAAASPATGGVSLALAVGGAALLLGGEKIAEAGVEMGLWSESAVQWVQLACSVAGSAMMLGSGILTAGAAGAEACTLIELVEIGEVCADVAQAALMVMAGTSQVVGAVHQHDEGMHRADGEELAVHRDEAMTEVEESSAELASLLEQFARVAKRLKAAMQARAECAQAAIRMMA